MPTRADIVADVTALRLPPRHAAVMVALGEYQSGLPVDQVCPDCGEPLVAAGLPLGSDPPRAWAVRCRCGEATFRGL